MLHKTPKIIAPKTFQLIQQLQALPELEGFHLAGGTALTLQLGHRNSIDIDCLRKKISMLLLGRSVYTRIASNTVTPLSFKAGMALYISLIPMFEKGSSM